MYNRTIPYGSITGMISMKNKQWRKNQATSQIEFKFHVHANCYIILEFRDVISYTKTCIFFVVNFVMNNWRQKLASFPEKKRNYRAFVYKGGISLINSYYLLDLAQYTLNFTTTYMLPSAKYKSTLTTLKWFPYSMLQHLPTMNNFSQQIVKIYSPFSVNILKG